MEQISIDFDANNLLLVDNPALWTPRDIWVHLNQRVLEMLKEDRRFERKDHKGSNILIYQSNIKMLDKRRHNIDNSGVDMKIPSYKDLISDLMESGMTQKEIGDHIGRSQAWVSAVFVGKFTDMKYQHAIALARLHADRCACTRIKKAA